MSEEHSGSVAVEVVPDARGWAEKLRAQIRDAVVKVQLDTEEADTKLDVLTARLDRLAGKSPSIHVDADTAAAEAELAALDAEADRATRDRHMNVGGSFGSIGSFLSDLSLLPSLAMAAGSALVPLAAVVGGLALTLGAPIAITAGGGTLFAFLAGFAVKGALAQQKQIDTLTKKLATLKKGTASYAQTQAQLAAAQKKLGPGQAGFLAALDKVKAAFHALPQGAIFGPLTAGLSLLAKVMPALAPVIGTVSKALSTLLTDLGKSFDSGSLKSLVDTFDKQLGPDIVAFGKIAGNVMRGLGAMFLTTGAQLSGGLLDGLVKLSAKFATFGQSRQFQAFLDYVKSEAPVVGHLLAQVGTAIGHIIVAAAPVGSVVLRALTILASAVASVPIPLLKGIAAGIAAIGAASLVLDLNPVVLAISALVLGLSYAWKHSETFRRVVTGAFHAVARGAVAMWNDFLEPTLKFLVSAWLHTTGVIIHGAAAAFGWVPRLGGKLHAAAAAFDSFAGSVINSIHKIPTNVHTTVSLLGVEGSRSALAGLQAQLNGLHNKTVTVTMAINNAGHAAAVHAQNHRAAGGPVAGRVSYLVGENGPEIYTPSSAGYITPNHVLRQAMASPSARPMAAGRMTVESRPYTGPVTLDFGEGLHAVAIMRAVAQDEIAAAR